MEKKRSSCSGLFSKTSRPAASTVLHQIRGVHRAPFPAGSGFVKRGAGNRIGNIRHPDRPEINSGARRHLPEQNLRQRQCLPGLRSDHKTQAMLLPAGGNVERLRPGAMRIGRSRIGGLQFRAAGQRAAHFEFNFNFPAFLQRSFRPEGEDHWIFCRFFQNLDFQHRIAGGVAQRIEEKPAAVSNCHCGIRLFERPLPQQPGSRRRRQYGARDKKKEEAFHCAISPALSGTTSIGPISIFCPRFTVRS